MAKRFTDTGKWEKPWFRKLSPLAKCVWFFLIERCDHAGIWEIDEEAFEYYVGQKFTITEITEQFGDRIRILGHKLIVTQFVEYQYGKLNPDNRVHKSVLARLDHLSPLLGPYLSQLSPLLGASGEKEGPSRELEGRKDKDKDKDKEKDGESEGGFFSLLPIVTQETLRQKYATDFRSAGISECREYYANDSASAKWTPNVWGKKITAWLLEKKRREGDKNDDLSKLIWPGDK